MGVGSGRRIEDSEGMKLFQLKAGMHKRTEQVETKEKKPCTLQA
jgi:hypothetical protein